ncbi:MAG: response regulator [Magnetococcales bacterium]|nr:response regulator [Magnetococcales bacterium]
MTDRQSKGGLHEPFMGRPITMLFLLVLGLGIGWDVYREYERTERVEEERLLSQTRVIAENMIFQMDAANRTMEYIRESLSYWRLLEDGWQRANRTLMALTNSMPGVRTLIVQDASGDIKSSNRVDLVGRNFSYRPYFSVARDRPDPEMLYVSPPFTTVLGVHTLNITRMIPGPGGEFGGIVTASLDPAYFWHLMESVRYAPDVWTAIVHGEGQVLRMAPERKDLAGRNVALPGTFFSRHRQSGREISSFRGVAHITGEERFVVMRTVSAEQLRADHALVVMASRDPWVVFAPWRQSMSIQVSLFLLVALLSVVGLILDQRRRAAFLLERRQAEAQLRFSEQRLRDILNNTSAIVFMKDLSGRYLFANRRLEDLLGPDAGNMLSKSDFDAFPEEVASLFQANDRLALASTDPITFEEQVPQADGLHTYISIKFALKGIDGKPYAVCGFATDITERKRMEEDLRRAKLAADAASQAKGEFLAVMSHEIRTPLNVILGMGDVLAEGALDGEQRECLRRLQGAGNSLLDLINQILDYSRIEANQLHFVEEPVAIRTLLREVAGMVGVLAQGKGIGWNCRLEDDLPAWVLGDAVRLRQVMFNLMGNAVKFTERGSITLRAGVGGGTEPVMQLRVEDTGIGIPEGKKELIFNAFAQADVSITRRFGGSGLGLTLARTLVERMGGGIRLESREGEGTVFQVELPLRPVDGPLEPPPEPARTLEPMDRAVALRILLAEDAEDNRMLIRAFLKNTPYLLEMAENGEEAVRMVREKAYAMVLMDVQMPVMDGYTATRRIRQWERENGREPLPILALTAHAMEGEVERSREAGCDRFLTKPIKKLRLLEVIREWARRTE